MEEPKEDVVKPVHEPDIPLGEVYLDNGFPADRTILPSRARKGMRSSIGSNLNLKCIELVWKRPKEINDKAQLFVNGVEEGDVIQVLLVLHHTLIWANNSSGCFG